MSIAILGAMQEEVDILREEMTDVTCEEIASRKYYSGTLYGKKTTLTFSRWGKVASAMAATALITKYNVESLIFVGVAGAISSQLNIGDIIIGNQLYQHDMDARPLFEQFEIPLTGQKFFLGDNQLCIKAKAAAEKFLSDGIKNTINSEILEEFSITKPKFYTGNIASGDSFIANATQKAEIARKLPEVLAVEMEGAAVAQVCYEHRIPFTVIRTISDKADHSAPINFTKFISHIAQHYSKNIIKAMYEIS